jgi:hypothetical protein
MVTVYFASVGFEMCGNVATQPQRLGFVSHIGFGLDSIIDVASGLAVLWRLHHDCHQSRREEVERTTLRMVGGCFVALALYILYESGSTLISRAGPRAEQSLESSSPPFRWWSCRCWPAARQRGSVVGGKRGIGGFEAAYGF